MVLLLSHLRLLDRVVLGDAFLLGDVSPCDLSYGRKISASCVLYKTYFRDGVQPPLRNLLLNRFAPLRNVSCVVLSHNFALVLVWQRTSPFSRTIFPSQVVL